MKYIKNSKYVFSNDNSDRASREDLISLLDIKTSEDQGSLFEIVKSEFLISDDYTVINGTKDAINKFKEIDNRKYDFNLTLQNIKNISFIKKNNRSNKYEIKFSIFEKDNEKIDNVNTIYMSKSKFLDYFLDMNKFADFMLENDKQLDLIEQIEKLSEDENIGAKNLIFRFIDTNDSEGEHTYLRSIISDRYKTYDNNIILYISVILINDLSKNMDKEFNLVEMNATDSTIDVYFLEKYGTIVDKDIEIVTGLRVSNSELGDGSAKFETIYRISNKKGKRFTAITDDIATINHGNKPETIIKKLNNLNNITNNRNETIESVKSLNLSKRVNRDFILKLMRKITHLRNVSPKLKDEMKKSIDVLNVTNEVYSLLDIFDKLDNFSDNEDGNVKLILEERFDKWLKEL